jgi:hypothetical protein
MHHLRSSLFNCLYNNSLFRFAISRGIGGQFRITQRSALSNLYKNSCCPCKQTISPAAQWYLTCQFKAFVDMQYFLKQFCCLSLIKLHIVQGVNNVQKCLITAFYQVQQGRTWSRSYKSPSSPTRFRILVFLHPIFNFAIFLPTFLPTF